MGILFLGGEVSTFLRRSSLIDMAAVMMASYLRATAGPIAV